MIYIGETSSVGKRTKNHFFAGKEITRVFYYEIDSEEDRILIEKKLIELFQPKYNGNCCANKKRDNEISELKKYIREVTQNILYKIDNIKNDSDEDL